MEFDLAYIPMVMLREHLISEKNSFQLFYQTWQIFLNYIPKKIKIHFIITMN